MLKGLDGYLSRKGLASPAALEGVALARMTRHDSLDRTVRLRAWEARPEKCTLCQRCILACSDAGANALSLDGLNLEIDAARCDGCSLCTYVCPFQVLELREVAGEPALAGSASA
jgi:dihydropyrimidine dehydrogenase (NAD+) subunit PreA